MPIRDTEQQSDPIYYTLIFLCLSQSTADVCTYAEPNRHILTFLHPIFYCAHHSLVSFLQNVNYKKDIFVL
jgi:hypothetical protein